MWWPKTIFLQDVSPVFIYRYISLETQFGSKTCSCPNSGKMFPKNMEKSVVLIHFRLTYACQKHAVVELNKVFFSFILNTSELGFVHFWNYAYLKGQTGPSYLDHCLTGVNSTVTINNHNQNFAHFLVTLVKNIGILCFTRKGHHLELFNFYENVSNPTRCSKSYRQ